MSNEVLTHDMAVLIGKLICPADFEQGKSEKISSVEEISQALGIRLNTVKHWIAEAVFVERIAVKTLITADFSEDDGAPLEILTHSLYCRLGVRFQEAFDVIRRK